MLASFSFALHEKTEKTQAYNELLNARLEILLHNHPNITLRVVFGLEIFVKHNWNGREDCLRRVVVRGGRFDIRLVEI